MSEIGLSLDTATSLTGFVLEVEDSVGATAVAEATRDVTEARLERRVAVREGEAVILSRGMVEGLDDFDDFTVLIARDEINRIINRRGTEQTMSRYPRPTPKFFGKICQRGSGPTSHVLL